jgi:hypothetical protein
MSYIGIYTKTKDEEYRLVCAMTNRTGDVYKRAPEMAQVMRALGVEKGILVFNELCNYPSSYDMPRLGSPDDVLHFQLLDNELQLQRYGDTPTNLDANGVVINLKSNMRILQLKLAVEGAIKPSYQEFINAISERLGDCEVEIWNEDGDDFLQAGM